jgi:uncharacterized delta-60 repeat protein
MFMSGRRLLSNKSSSHRFCHTRLGVEPLESRVVMTAGMLDLSFGGGDGIGTAEMGPDTGSGGGIQVEGDKIIVAGKIQGATTTTGTGRNAVTTTDPGDFGIARYNADGSLDSTFSGDGKASASFGPKSDNVYDMAVTPDGKYVVVGETTVTTTVTVGKKTTTTTSLDFAIARFNADGSLDSSFSGDGKQTVDFGGAEHGFAVTVQPNGQIIVAGQQMGNNFDSKFVLTRLNINGSLDATFGAGGKVITNIGESDVLHDVALQTVGADTFIVAAGRVDIMSGSTGGSNYEAALVRYRLDGSLDTSFGVGGIVLTDINGVSGTITDIAIGTSGEILGSSYVQANGDTDIALMRYATNGVLVGVSVVPLPNQQLPEGIVVRPDGKIVVAGRSKAASTGNGTQSLAVRFTSTGDLDSSFGSSGITLWDVNPNNGGTYVDEMTTGVAINANGQIFISGYMRPAGASSNTTWTVTRLTGDDIVTALAEKSTEESLYDLAILAMTGDELSDE